jgi:hypothetical protein
MADQPASQYEMRGAVGMLKYIPQLYICMVFWLNFEL